MIGLRAAAAQLDTAVNIAFHAITHRFGLAISDVHWVAAMGHGMCRVSEGRERTTLPADVVVAALARQLPLRVTCAASIDQYACITAKMYAALTPNSSIPSTASKAPIICQCRCSVSPDSPRVLIESTE
jgi:hypothetical protein